MSALESLLFAKYQMYRNVYWHHAVRSATCMFKRAVRGAVRRGSVTMDAIAEATDDGLMEQLITRDGNALAAAIRARRLHKRALDLAASDVPERAEPWVSGGSPPGRAGRGRARARGGAGPGRPAARFPGTLLDAGRGPAAPHPERLGRAADRRRAARDSSASHGSPTSSTGARAACGCSWRRRRDGRSAASPTC